MAQSRTWARSRPWMVIFPAISFFASVTGFNLLGEGLRRLIDRGVFNTAALLSWRVLLAVAVITASSIYVMLTLGPAPSYRQLAEQVSEADMVRHIEYLSSPDLNGRAVGSDEAYEAAQYIRDELMSYELETFIHEVDVTMVHPTEPPVLDLVDEEGDQIASFTRIADFGESVERYGGDGEAEAPITLVLFSPADANRRWTLYDSYARFRGLDLRGRIVMVLAGNAPYDFDTEAMIRGAEGVLVVSTDVNARNQVVYGNDLDHPSLPVFRISYATADAMLAVDGLDLDGVREDIELLDESETDWVTRDLSARVHMQVSFGDPEEVTLYNVMGLMDGSDAQLADEVVIVSSHYDGLGRGPDGTLYPGADENASGVAVMLEIARLWQEQEFQPRRTVLFVSWAGGSLRYSGAHGFIDRPGILGSYDVSSVIHLDRMGGVDGEGLAIRQLGARDTMLNLFINSASNMDVEIYGGAAVRHPYQQVFQGRFEPRYGALIVTWGDPEPALAADTFEGIDPLHLSQAAQAVNLTLITAAHEPQF